MKKIKILFLLVLVSVVTSCSKDDDGGNDSKSACLKDNFTLKETKVQNLDSSNSIIVTFSLTNNSSTDYSIQNGSTPINTKMIVTTTDGEKFETKNLLTVTSLSAGATTSVDVLGNYGADKMYESYEISLTCE